MEHRIYKRKCNRCGKYYEGRGKYFCSNSCAKKENTFGFKKGHTPWNKGLTDYLSKQSRKNISEASKKRKGPKNSFWKGGLYRKADGHYMIYAPNHPFNRNNYVRRSHLIMEKKINRYLRPEEIVHHINGNPSDDHLENLMLLKNQSIHLKIHNPGFKKGHPIYPGCEKGWFKKKN